MNAKKLLENVYYIPGPTNTGIICTKEHEKNIVYLVDSGMDDKDAERIYGEICELFPEDKGGFELRAILNTHSHADHAGGNAWFQERTNCQIWITYGEAGSLLNPELQSIIVCGGNVISEFKSSYSKARPSKPTNFIDINSRITFSDGSRITFKSLPGHYLEMVGVLYTDKDDKTVFFTGDAVFGQAHILKYWIPFLYDVGEFKNTLEMLSNTYYNYYIPSHGECVTRIQETTELNMIAILSTEYCVLSEIQKHPVTKEQLLKAVAERNDITFKMSQYLFINCTLNAYLNYLKDNKKINAKLEDNQLIWFTDH